MSNGRTILFASLLFTWSHQVWAQFRANYIEWRMRNDDLGEFSNRMSSGDDVGETYSLYLAYVNQLNSSPLNFKLEFETTEFSAYNKSTKEPKDILFNEWNYFRLSIDNRRYNPMFFSGALGLNYVQSNHVSAGATGQKFLIHKMLLSSLYYQQYWIYISTDEPNHYFPFASAMVGYGDRWQLWKCSNVIAQATLGGQGSNDRNFSWYGTEVLVHWMFNFKRPFEWSVTCESEGVYQANPLFRNAYWQTGLRLGYKRTALLLAYRKPIAKNLDSPYIRYNDMEPLYIVGVRTFFKRDTEPSSGESRKKSKKFGQAWKSNFH